MAAVAKLTIQQVAVVGLLIGAFSSFHFVNAVPIVYPQQLTVGVGESVSLICRVTLAVHRPVDWRFMADADTKEYDIISSDRIVNGFDKKYQTVVRGNEHWLIINNAQSDDSGRYTCVEDSGFGEAASANIGISHIDAITAASVTPKNATSLYGSSVTLICRTNSHGAIDWRYRRDGLDSLREKDIVSSGRLVNGYADIYTVEVIGNQHMITIKNVTCDTGGYYTCIDDAGFGESDTAYVGVTSRDDCQSSPAVLEEKNAQDIRSTVHGTGSAMSLLILTTTTIIIICIIAFIAVIYLMKMRHHNKPCADCQEHGEQTKHCLQNDCNEKKFDCSKHLTA